MKASNLLFVLTALVCGLLLPQQVRAGSTITGATSITYDADSNIVTGTTMTELDYASQDWYQAVVRGTILDSNNNALASSGTLHDIDRDGTVSATLEVTGTDQMQYTMTGYHIALADIQDYVSGGSYVDYWGFQKVYNGENSYYLYMPFFAPGPGGSIRLRAISLGKTYATVQAKPKVTSGTPTFSSNSIAVTTGSTTLNTEISASTIGLQSGDYAVVEVIQETGNSTAVSFPNPPGQVQNVPLVLGNHTTASFTISAVSATGTYTFTVRIADIFRPSTNGGAPTSLLNNNGVTVNTNGVTSGTLTVHP